jgi:hypothetical protein
VKNLEITIREGHKARVYLQVHNFPGLDCDLTIEEAKKMIADLQAAVDHAETGAYQEGFRA